MLQRRAAGLIELCLPKPAKAPPSVPDWLHEIKLHAQRLCVPPTGESECEQNRAVPAETVRLIPVLKAGADVAKEVKPVIQIVDGTQPEAGAGWGSGGWRLVEQFQADLQIRREFARQHPTGHARIFRAFGVELATTAAERGPVVA
jgi:hypothetical protein